MPYRGVIFDERDPKSYTNITLDHYSEVFGGTDLTFTIKCDDVTIDGDCGDVYFETENRKIELEKLCLYDVYKTTVDFKQDVIGEVDINDVSFIELTVEEHISDKARIEIKNVHSTDDNDCRLILDGNGSRDREPSYIMKDLNFKRGLYKFNAPNGVLLNKLGVIRSDKPNKICEVDSRSQIKIDCGGLTSGLIFDSRYGTKSVLRGNDIIVESVKDDFTFAIAEENVIDGVFHFNDKSSGASKTKNIFDKF